MSNTYFNEKVGEKNSRQEIHLTAYVGPEECRYMTQITLVPGGYAHLTPDQAKRMAAALRTPEWKPDPGDCYFADVIGLTDDLKVVKLQGYWSNKIRMTIGRDVVNLTLRQAEKLADGLDVRDHISATGPPQNWEVYVPSLRARAVG
jgi:hypothetical protein